MQDAFEGIKGKHQNSFGGNETETVQDEQRGGETVNEKQITQRSVSVTGNKIFTTSDMSYQVCGCCGWSKATTYRGLRIHQGKMGCTPKGMRIPESEQYRFNSFTPKFTLEPAVKVEKPFVDIFTSSVKSGREWNALRSLLEEADYSSPVRNEPFLTPVSQAFNMQTNLAAAEAILKETNKSVFETPVLSNHTTTSVRRALDFSTGAQQPFLMPVSQTLNTHPTDAEAILKETNKSHTLYNFFETPQPSYQTIPSAHRALDFSTGAQQPFLMPVSQTLNTHPTDAEAILKETNKSHTLYNFFETPQPSYQTIPSARRALDFSTGAQQPFLMPVSQTLNTHPTDAEAILKETNKSHTLYNFFETPQPSYQTIPSAHRALDFSTGAQQVGQLRWDLQTIQETAVAVQESKREQEREAQKLLKARQDKIRADLQQQIQMREQKMAEVRSSANAFKGSLDTEYQEINKVFSEVMRVVEDTWKKALQPLKERRHRVKKEAQDLIKKLQKETDKLKRTMDELDQNSDFQVSPLTGLDESRVWKNVTVDVSFSLGTLRCQTSNMMKQIQQNLEKLSSVELKRIPTFAVDVKLDPTTAHRCLALSLDGKEVRDGGMNPKVPAGPERFDTFGSILGLNRLTSGKSYWEVEVSNKTGWDLGVARRNANRKGKLSLTPDNGYWVTVHYEDEKYAALSDPPVSLSLTVKPQKVGVFVDYEEGLVSFYDVTARSHIYSFTECSFSDEICPYFSPHLQQNKKNLGPLVISAVKKHRKL